MGYAPGLAWVIYNQKLAFHRGGTIIKATSFLLLRSTPRSIIIPIMIFELGLLSYLSKPLIMEL